jgi:phosphate transport system substrate-binding protein
LAAIFTGQVRSWNQVGGADAPLVLYSRENSSGTYEFFKEHVLKGRDFAPSTQTMPGTAAVLQAVARDPGGIGYGGAAFAAGVRLLRVSRDADSPSFEPTPDNVTSGRYPISRYLYVYVNPAQDQGEIAAFLDWIRGDAGQAIVKDVGYFPLPADLRNRPGAIEPSAVLPGVDHGSSGRR